MRVRSLSIVLVAAALGVSGNWLLAPSAQAAGGLIEDAVLRECIADAMYEHGIVGAPGSPDYDALLDEVLQADLDALAASSEVSLYCGAGINSLEGLQNYHGTQLVYLDVFDGGITDLSPLTTLTSLKVLGLGGNSISNISALSSLTNLEELRLHGNNITNVSALSSLTNLTDLALDWNGITDVSPLGTLTQLEILGLSDNDFTDVSALASLTQLNMLWLDFNSIDAASLATLSGLTNLETLLVRYTGLGDLSVLSGFTNLYYLNLEGNLVSDLGPLAGLTNLGELDLMRNDVSDLHPLESLTNLTQLNLRENHVSDLSLLAGLSQLEYLDIGYNDVTDLSPLAGLTNLQYLSIDSNNVTDLSALAGWTDPQTRYGLNASANHISDLSQIPRLCTKADGNEFWTGDDDVYCTLVVASFQTLTATAGAGSAVALPKVVGLVDDPVTWRVIQGQATLNGNGTITYSAPGTYILAFQDTPGAADRSRFMMLMDEAECALYGGSWEFTYTGECTMDATFAGIVTVTVTARTGPVVEVNTGGEASNAAMPAVAVLMVLAGVMVATRRVCAVR